MQKESMVGKGLFEVIKGTVTALVCAFLFAVVFAVLLRSFPLPDKVIYPVNQTIKLLCVFVGALAFVRGEKGYAKGIAVALLFTALSYLTFSALGGTFRLRWVLIVELILTALSGFVGGSMGVNFNRN